MTSLHVIAGPGYWATRAMLKREAWALMPEAFVRRRRGPKPAPKAAIDAYLAGAKVREILAKYGTHPTAFYSALRAAGIEKRGKRAQARGPADTARAEEFARRYRAGETSEAIARDYKITGERVRQILRKAGVESLGHRPGHSRKPVPLTEAEREALRLYQSGVRPKEIAERTNVPTSHMQSVLRRGGIPAKGAGYWLTRPDDAELTAEIARLYTSGMGASEIARTVPQIKFPETVYRYLKKAGVTPRYERGGSRPKIPNSAPPDCSEGAGGSVQAPGAAYKGPST